MKKLLTFLALAISLNNFAQFPENSNWCFGHQAGLTFDISSGIVSPTTSALSISNPGYSGNAASVSDANGLLRFYTDALTVWDRTHTPMPQGYQTRRTHIRKTVPLYLIKRTTTYTLLILTQ